MLYISMVLNRGSTIQDPVKDGEKKIKKDFEDLHDRMQAGFRALLVDLSWGMMKLEEEVVAMSHSY